jgi:hypothetical protein
LIAEIVSAARTPRRCARFRQRRHDVWARISPESGEMRAQTDLIESHRAR